MKMKTIAALAAILGAGAVSTQASAAAPHDLQGLKGISAGSALTKVACGPQYRPVHHRRSSNTLCVFRGVAGGGKLKAKTKPKP